MSTKIHSRWEAPYCYIDGPPPLPELEMEVTKEEARELVGIYLTQKVWLFCTPEVVRANLEIAKKYIISHNHLSWAHLYITDGVDRLSTLGVNYKINPKFVLSVLRKFGKTIDPLTLEIVKLKKWRGV